MLKKILLLSALCFFVQSFAQELVTKPEIPGVNINSLAEKVSPVDASAPAAYLYRHGTTYFSHRSNYWVMVTEVYTRVKIYNKEGYKYANPQLVYYSDGSGIKSSYVNAATYNLEDGKVTKTPLKSESEFKETIEGEYTWKNITLPNVKEGSIIEYTTIVETPYFGNFQDFYFQYDIPVNDVRYDVSIPIYFVYNIYKVGYADIKNHDAKRVYNKASDTDEFYYLYTAKNVKPFKDEQYINTSENYISKLQHELSLVQMPKQAPKTYATSWATVSKNIFKHERFGKELKLTNFISEDLDGVVKGLASDQDKLNAIFNYVQSYMKWNGRFGYLCSKGVKEAYKDKSGNVADINLMLTAMLREAGLDANPVILSTRAHGIAHFASTEAFNYVIASVNISDKTILLDATSKYTKPDMLPTRALNWKGRLIKKNGDNVEVDLMPKASSKENINIVATMAQDGTISGRVRDNYLDQVAYSYRERYAELSKDSYLEALEKNYKGLEISDYKLVNHLELDKPVVEEYSFVSKGSVEAIGSNLYVTPLLYLAETDMPFTAEKREYPVDFIYPHENKYSIAITIPQGYTVESLPQGLNIAMAENIGSFKYNVASNGNTIQIQAAFAINYASVSEEYYTVIRDFYKQMLEKQSEKIVLKKS